MGPPGSGRRPPAGRPDPSLQHTNYVATVAFSPDGTTLAAGDYGPAGLVKLWDWRTGKEVRPPLRHDDIVLNVSFSPDGRYLAAIKQYDWSKNPELLVWEVASGKAVFRVHYDCPSYLLRESTRFRPDGRAFAARDMNGVLRLWEVPSGKLLGERPLDGDGVTRFSPDGRVVAAAANLGVRLLDGDTLAPLPAGYLPHPDPITDVAFSPDGAFLLVGYESGSAQLWDVATRKPVGPPAVLIGAIRAVTFTPDGKTCVCVAADGTVRRWPVPAPFAEPDLARLADRVALMTGQRMDDNQGLDSVPADEWRALRAKLVGDGSTALVPPRPDADWHDAVAADAEQDGDSYGAEWHLDRLAALRPDDWTIPARRGRVLAAAGRKDEADAAYAAAAPPGPVPAGAVRLAAGRRRGRRGGRPEGGGAVEPGPGRRADPGRLDPVRAAGRPGRPGRGRSPTSTRRSAAGPSRAIVVRAAVPGGRVRRLEAGRGAVQQPRPEPGPPAPGPLPPGRRESEGRRRAGYRAACAGIAKRLPPVGPKLSAGEANNAATAFALGPNATDDWAEAARLDRPRPGPARRAREGEPATRRTHSAGSGTCS